jgi:hypothetical protein
MNSTPPVPLRNRTDLSGTCGAPGCTNAVHRQRTGRPASFCSSACRAREFRSRKQATTAPVSVEVDRGSATSRGRPPERAWLVRIRRGGSYVIINTGLRRPDADRLAEQLTDLLGDKLPGAP